MGLKDRLKRLRERHGLGRHVLVCPECEAEVVIHGDVALDYIVASWVRQSGGGDHYETPPAVAALLDHEHEPSNFREKTTGLTFLSQELSGMRAFGPASRWEDRP